MNDGFDSVEGFKALIDTIRELYRRRHRRCNIDFGGTIGRRVPVDKPITIVTFRNGQPVPAQNVVCGPRTDPRTKPWCPFDTPAR